jgi:ATP-dependent RNA helicase RhlE
MNFDPFNLHPSLMAGIRAMRYASPTPIQSQAIPLVLQGRDVIGLAQTGAGKTAAFGLPILHRLHAGQPGSVRALVISPTRELAEQTCEVLNKLGEKTGLASIAIDGDISMPKQIRALQCGPDIIVACPRRLLDHLWKGTISLTSVEVLVIDEADRMFDMGLLPDIRNILDCIGHQHQTLLFSATMPDGIRRLVKDVLRDPVTVQVDRAFPAGNVSHVIRPVEQHLKTGLLKDILDQTTTKSVLVFTSTRWRAEKVARRLVTAGYRVSSLQGNLSQNRRQAALSGFRDGAVKILVATDIAARGIDVVNISHVINYEAPETADDQSHRTSRRSRAAEPGDAMTIVTPADEDRLQALEKLLESPLERLTLPGFDYGRPVRQP